MKKPPYLSNKKWNKKFKKNIKKFKNLTDPSNGKKFNESTYIQFNPVLPERVFKKWLLVIGLLTLVKEAITKILVKFTSKIRELILGSQERVPADFDEKIENLEEMLKRYLKKIEALELEVSKHSEIFKKFDDQHTASNGGLIKSDPQIQKSVLPPPPPPLPPPPPPPLPPGGLNIQNQIGAKRSSVIKNQSQVQLMRPTISLEDIINVKLKHTPCIQRSDRLKKMSTPPNGLPRISLEALRSVKLKKTSLLKETSPLKSKSPKGKIRPVLRRLSATPKFEGTPRGERICLQDDLTPIMTRVLLKRFNAFQMSPDEENKENDMQFL